MNYQRRFCGDAAAPPFVEAVQYKHKGTFYDKKNFLEFVEGKVSVTIYAECVVAHVKAGNIKVGHEDWILWAEGNLYFLDNATFQKTYEPEETMRTNTSVPGE